MQIDIQSRHFTLTDALRNHTKRCLGFALSTKGNHIRHVTVRLSDISGPKGGTDKCCLIQVVFAHLPNVVIEDTETDLYAAIDRAADRAVGRRLARQRDMRRSSVLHDSIPVDE